MSETLGTAALPIDSTLSTVSRIYCGMSQQGTYEPITRDQMEQFIRDSVTTQFPDGYTVIWAQGGWRDLNTDKPIEEPSAIIEIAHGSQDKGRILDLARAYKSQFGQQAVMVTSTPIQTQFI